MFTHYVQTIIIILNCCNFDFLLLQTSWLDQEGLPKSLLSGAKSSASESSCKIEWVRNGGREREIHVDTVEGEGESKRRGRLREWRERERRRRREREGE